MYFEFFTFFTMSVLALLFLNLLTRGRIPKITKNTPDYIAPEEVRFSELYFRVSNKVRQLFIGFVTYIFYTLLGLFAVGVGFFLIISVGYFLGTCGSTGDVQQYCNMQSYVTFLKNTYGDLFKWLISLK